MCRRADDEYHAGSNASQPAVGGAALLSLAALAAAILEGSHAVVFGVKATRESDPRRGSDPNRVGQ